MVVEREVEREAEQGDDGLFCQHMGETAYEDDHADAWVLEAVPVEEQDLLSTT